MLDRLQPDLRDLLDLQVKMRMRFGQEVGQLVRDRFPAGEIARIPADPNRSLERTDKLIEDGVETLYEPTFEFEGVLIQADVLRKDRRGWELYEVKSSTGVEDHHLWDLAAQVYVLNGVGLELEETYLLHLNREYQRQGELDLEQLFVPAALLEEVKRILPQVERSIRDSKQLIENGRVPERDIGPFCLDPDDCDFKGHCWQHLPEPSVFDVYRLPKTKKFELYSQGVTRLADIPPEYPMPKTSRFHVESQRHAAPLIDRPGLLTFLDGLHSPLLFLDFETFSLPIPPYDGLRPYSQVPFQFSLHRREKPGSELQHFEFIASPGSDPRPSFVHKLLEVTTGAGDLVVYNASFERGVLRALADRFPEYLSELEDRISRLVDLLDPFRQQIYYDPAIGGSLSLKNVLPVLVPDLSYSGLQVQDGTMAMDAYLSLSEVETDAQLEAMLTALKQYCELDTLALVEILAVLEQVVYDESSA
jgi:hypothetical protein